MNTPLSLKTVGNTISLFLAITYVACVIFDLIIPGHAMYRSWEALLPGFRWLDFKSFVLGLVESYAFGWYFALIWVTLYNLFSRRASKSSKTSQPVGEVRQV